MSHQTGNNAPVSAAPGAERGGPVFIDRSNYTVVWKFMPQGWASHLSTQPAPAVMPYFVDGLAHRQLRRCEPAHLNDFMLLKGLLHAWLDPLDRWQCARRDTLERFRVALLADMRVGFGFGSTEQLVLRVGRNVRSRNGHLPALKMLMAGHDLVPASAGVRRELITDLWALVRRCDQVDKRIAFDLIRRLYDGLRIEEVESHWADRLDYINLVALSHLGEHEKRNRLFWRVVAKRVRNGAIKRRMIRLLSQDVPAPLEPDEAASMEPGRSIERGPTGNIPRVAGPSQCPPSIG